MKPSIESKVIEFITAIANVIYELKSTPNTGNELMSHYLTMYSNKEEYRYLVPTITDTYKWLAATVKEVNKSRNFHQLEMPALFMFWETEALNRRVDRRHTVGYEKGIKVPGMIDLRKYAWKGHNFVHLSLPLDNNNFGWIERDYLLGSCTDEDRFYEIFSRVQLHYFKCTRGHSRDKSMYTFDSIIWKMLLDDFYACTGNRNGIQIQSYYNHLLRQSMNELDCGSWYTKAGWAA